MKHPTDSRLFNVRIFTLAGGYHAVITPEEANEFTGICQASGLDERLAISEMIQRRIASGAFSENWEAEVMAHQRLLQEAYQFSKQWHAELMARVSPPEE